MFGIISIALAFLAQLLGGVLQVSLREEAAEWSEINRTE